MAVFAGEWSDTFTDERGNAVTDLEVTVYEADGTTVATLYTDRTKATELDNPLPAGEPGLENGNAQFFAEPGAYVVVADRGATEVWRRPETVYTDPEDVASSAEPIAIDHIADTDAAHAASAVAVTPFGTITSTNAQDALEELLGEAGGGGGTAASTTLDPFEGVSSTNVQDGLEELSQNTGAAVNDEANDRADADTALAADLAAHLADPADAHDASAVSFVPAAGLGSTDVQAALEELSGASQTADTAEANARSSADATEVADRTAADDAITAAYEAADVLEADARADADALLIPLGQKGAANGVAPLGADTKIPTLYLPTITFGETFIVGSQAAMLALAAAPGDVAVRTDQPKTYILDGDPTVLGDWVEILVPPSPVASVDGRTGSVSLSDLYAPISEVASRAADVDAEEAARIAAVSAEAAARAAADALMVPRSRSFHTLDYGLLPDGNPASAATNRTAINNAIAAAAASNLIGAEVILPQGVIYADGIVVKSFTQLLGQGFSTFIVRPKGSSNDAIIRSEGFNTAAPVYGVSVKGLCLDGNYIKNLDGTAEHVNPDADAPGGPGGDGLAIFGQHVEVEHVYVKNCKGIGLDLRQSATFGAGALNLGVHFHVDHVSTINCYGALGLPYSLNWAAVDGFLSHFSVINWDEEVDHLITPGSPYPATAVGQIGLVLSAGGAKVSNGHIWGSGIWTGLYAFGGGQVVDTVTVEIGHASLAVPAYNLWVYGGDSSFDNMDIYNNSAEHAQATGVRMGLEGVQDAGFTRFSGKLRSVGRAAFDWELASRGCDIDASVRRTINSEDSHGDGTGPLILHEDRIDLALHKRVDVFATGWTE